MTSRPGDLAPPPPPSGYGQGPFDGGATTATPSEYTSWFKRVIATILDSIPVLLLTGIGGVVLVAMQKVETVCLTDDSEYQLGEFCATGNNGPSMPAWIIFAVCMLLAVGFSLWNYIVRQGNTGSTIGKELMKFKVVDDASRQPIGAGKSFIRQIAHGIDGAICYIGYLFPLWDAKRQTIADKLLKTVCVPR